MPIPHSESLRKYSHTEKGKAVMKKALKKYRQSAKGKATRKRGQTDQQKQQASLRAALRWRSDEAVAKRKAARKVWPTPTTRREVLNERQRRYYAAKKAALPLV